MRLTLETLGKIPHWPIILMIDRSLRHSAGFFWVKAFSVLTSNVLLVQIEPTFLPNFSATTMSNFCIRGEWHFFSNLQDRSVLFDWIHPSSAHCCVAIAKLNVWSNNVLVVPLPQGGGGVRLSLRYLCGYKNNWVIVDKKIEWSSCAF